MEPLILPDLPPRQHASWDALIKVSRRVTGGWCLTGGQMVQLLCWERGASPNRPTDDGDALLDVRARPAIVVEFTRALVDIGFEPEADPSGRNTHWTDGRARIDILMPDDLGPRGDRRGIRGGAPIASPGAQNVLDRAQPVVVSLDDRVGTILRPNMQGALIAKSFAFAGD